MLWERRAVQELIEQRFALVLPLRTVGGYLARWGFSCQRPAVRVDEQQPRAVRKWVKEEYPAMASPELNPDEYLNNDLKATSTGASDPGTWRPWRVTCVHTSK